MPPTVPTVHQGVARRAIVEGLRRPSPLAVLALGALAGSVALMAAWAIDSRAHRGRVLPNATLAGAHIRGQAAGELERGVAELAGQFAQATVEVRTSGGTFRTSMPELGISVDEGRTVDAALTAGRRGWVPGRLLRWATSFAVPVDIPVALAVDRATLDRVVRELDPDRQPAAEPFLALRDGRLVGMGGRPGAGIDTAAVVRAIQRAEPTTGLIVAKVARAPLPPRFTKDDAQRLADRAEELVQGGLSVTAGAQTAAVGPVLRLWVEAVAADDRLRLGIKPDADIAGDLAKLLPEAGTAPVDAGFAVVGGRVQVVPPKPGTACCAPGAAAVLDAAVGAVGQPGAAAGPSGIGPVAVPLRPVPARRDEVAARTLGVTELIGTFTTNHAAGEPRVTNIHRMADLLRGTLIEPGGTWSINGIVGRRTTEQGFVEAPIIGGDYVFETDVGGGVSQFATTAFNAAFFAGMDVLEYAMHGLYIGRYPYGREATLSFPAPDLRLRNPSPYAVLVWTSYTSTSITVSLYSTRWVSGEQTAQAVEERPVSFVPDNLKEMHEKEPFKCTAVVTERTRTFVDLRPPAVDRFRALYSPREGVRCG